MHLRPATMEDAELLHAWRNDPETRANSHNTDEVPWDNHVAWLAKSLENPNRNLLIAEIAGVPVATGRADLGDVTELSWTVSPNHRGCGVGTKLVKALVTRFGPPLRAEVLAHNVASQKIALAAGFAKDGEKEGVIHFMLRTPTP